jgi:hypothetical protein
MRAGSLGVSSAGDSVENLVLPVLNVLPVLVVLVVLTGGHLEGF